MNRNITVLLRGENSKTNLSLHAVGTRTLPRQRKTVGAIGFGHIDASAAAAAEDGNDENKEFLSSSSNSHNLPYV